MFHELFGLKVQLAKSVVIALNATVTQREYAGISVLPAGATTRYLGVQVGVTRTDEANWQKRIASLKVRLAVAAQVATSIIERIKILNAIALPAILFTAQFSRASDKTLQDLENIQKQFLWARKLSTEGRRHKMNPCLMFSPVKNGGMGLLSIRVAIKALLMRRATNWLVTDGGVYKACWSHLLAQGRRQTNLTTPAAPSRRKKKREEERATVQADGVELAIKHWSKQGDRQDWWGLKATQHQDKMLATTAVKRNINGISILKIDEEADHPNWELPEEIANFWPVFDWEDNPWIIDQNGNTLHRTRFTQMQPCGLAALGIRRTGASEWAFRRGHSDHDSTAGEQHDTGHTGWWSG